MLRVLLPMLFGTMCRPTTVRALKLDRFGCRLCVGMYSTMMPGTHRAWCKCLDSLATGTNGGERRLAEWMEEVVLGEYRFFRFRLVLRGFFEPREKAPRVTRAQPTSLQDRPLAEEGRLAVK